MKLFPLITVVSLFIVGCSKDKQAIRKAAKDRVRIDLYFDQASSSYLTDTIHLSDSIIVNSSYIDYTCNLVVKQGAFEFEKLMFQIEDSVKIVLTNDTNGIPTSFKYYNETSEWKKTNIDFIDPFSDKLFIPVRFSLFKGVGYYNFKFIAYCYNNLDSSQVISKKIYIRY